MVTHPRPRVPAPRRASAAVELAVMLMITSYAGIPSSFDLSRTGQMPLVPVLPKNS
jgi:hypothetical protein